MRNNNKDFNSNCKIYNGFTLIELLVAIAILGILAAVAMGGFRISQMRGRDAQRKSDLKQIAAALELFYSDHGSYPQSTADGKIRACTYSATPQTCTWGESEFADANTTYFKKLPQDPSTAAYFYKALPDTTSPQSYALFAYIENPKDPNILTGITYSCTLANCNFAITSSNSIYTDF